MREWDPEAVKQAIDMDLHLGDGASTSEQLAIKRIRDNAAFAADSIVYLAMHSENESIRFKAAQYILDRVMGRVTDTPITESTEDAYSRLMEGVVSAN